MKKLIVFFAILSVFLTGPAFSAQNWRLYTPGNSTLEDRDIRSVFVDSDGIVWMGTSGHGVNSYDSATDTFTAHNETSTTKINDIAQIGDYIYFATSVGLYRYNKTTNEWLVALTTAKSLPHNYLTSLAVQGENTLWIATVNGIAKCVNPEQTDPAITPYNTSHGLADNEVSSIDFRASDNTLWVATWEGLCKYNGTSWATYKKVDGLINDYIADVKISADGTVWAAHYCGWDWKTNKLISGGLSKQAAGSETWDKVTSANGIDKYGVAKIAFGADGNPWVVTISDYISHFNGESWVNYKSGSSGLTLSSKTSIAVSENDVWAGTMEGLQRFHTLNNTLSFSVNYRNITYGKIVRIDSILAENDLGQSGERVYFQRFSIPKYSDDWDDDWDWDDDYWDESWYEYFKYNALYSGLTDENGLLYYRFRPAKNCYLRAYRMLDNGALISRTLYVTVKPRVTFGVNAKIRRPGRNFRFYGRVAPLHRSTLMALQQYRNKRWVTIKRMKTNRYSDYSVYWNSKTKGSYKMRVAFYNDGDHVAAYTSSRTVYVR